MSWMNRYDIDEAKDRYRTHEVLGPASCTLYNLMNWVDANSDGWPYWTKPHKAAERLMELIVGHTMRYVRCQEPQSLADLASEYQRALTPIKSFRTRMNADFEIVERRPQ